MNNDLISREALKKAISEHCRSETECLNHFWYDENIISLIDNAPTVFAYTEDDMCQATVDGYDVAKMQFERPQGKWIYNKEMSTTCSLWNCSVCNRLNGNDSFNFCPDCGAKMKKGGAE